MGVGTSEFGPQQKPGLWLGTTWPGVPTSDYPDVERLTSLLGASYLIKYPNLYCFDT